VTLPPSGVGQGARAALGSVTTHAEQHVDSEPDEVVDGDVDVDRGRANVPRIVPPCLWMVSTMPWLMT